MMQISSTKDLLYISLPLAAGKEPYLTPVMKRSREEELSFYKLFMLEMAINEEFEYFWFENTSLSIQLKRTTHNNPTQEGR